MFSLVGPLGWRFPFLDDVLGHQGSAATYPSSTDLVALEHLRNHTGKPRLALDHRPDIYMTSFFKLQSEAGMRRVTKLDLAFFIKFPLPSFTLL